MTIAGLILAGGRGTRLGEVDKALIPLGGRPLIAHARQRLERQVDSLYISANGDPARFEGTLPVLADSLADHPGPLAGILAGLERAADDGHAALVSVACDTPFFPLDLVARLRAEGDGMVAVAESRGRRHPVFALWPVALAADMRAVLRSGQRGVGAFIAAHPHRAVNFDAAGIDPFFNVNTPADLVEAGSIVQG